MNLVVVAGPYSSGFSGVGEGCGAAVLAVWAGILCWCGTRHKSRAFAPHVDRRYRVTLVLRFFISPAEGLDVSSIHSGASVSGCHAGSHYFGLTLGSLPNIHAAHPNR